MRILITGIAGTWGRGFTELLHNEHELLGYDNTEESVAKFKHDYPDVTVRLRNFSKWNFEKDPVDLIIHLAAYKHIDLCEVNPMGCVANNVLETYEMFMEAKRHDVKILFISTDKAVEPVSAYGMSKALGERMCLACGGQVARSGNIIGSNGSVFQIWNDLIAKKQKVKITDPEMMRYFIKVGYAIEESWKGFVEGKKLNIIRGEEKTLADFLGEILVNNGYDYDYTKYPYGVEIVGRRPGEKMREKLVWDNEEEK